MIKLEKNSKVPVNLTSERVTGELDRLERTVVGGGDITYRDFKSELYGAEDVRTTLKTDQHGKCAYCESRLDVSSPTHVEHFRPKTYSQQGKERIIHRPGYYWLAYDWNNLLAACTVCNQQYKKNYFPLTDDLQRADWHRKDLSSENPLLINPYTEDPDTHLIFRREIAVGLTPKGRTSVEYYGLNRKALLKERQEKYEFYKTLQAVLQTLEASQKQDTETYRKTSDLLEKMTSHEACYSGMLCYQGNELF